MDGKWAGFVLGSVDYVEKTNDEVLWKTLVSMGCVCWN